MLSVRSAVVVQSMLYTIHCYVEHTRRSVHFFGVMQMGRRLFSRDAEGVGMWLLFCEISQDPSAWKHTKNVLAAKPEPRKPLISLTSQTVLDNVLGASPRFGPFCLWWGLPNGEGMSGIG